MFLLLRLLILTWISLSELGHINSTPLFCATRFWHAWVQIVPFQSCMEISSCVWYQMKEGEMPLNMKHIVWLKLGRQWRYLTEKTGFLFSGTHGIEDNWHTSLILADETNLVVAVRRHPFSILALRQRYALLEPIVRWLLLRPRGVDYERIVDPPERLSVASEANVVLIHGVGADKFSQEFLLIKTSDGCKVCTCTNGYKITLTKFEILGHFYDPSHRGLLGLCHVPMFPATLLLLLFCISTLMS